MTKICRALWLPVVVTTLCGIALAQLPVTDDTYVSSAAPTTNNGNSTSLVVQKASSGTTLIKIDLSQLTGAGVTSSQVSKAYLKVYATAVTGQGTFDLYKITASWAEGTVTYNTTPAMTLVLAGTTCPSGVQCLNAASRYFQFDITSLVQAWLTTPSSNFGLALKPNATTISATLESKESTTTSHAPEVDVVLTPGLGGTVTSIGTGTGLTGGPITTSGTISLLPANGLSLGGVKVPACAAGTHFSGIAGDGSLTCSADATTSSLSFSVITSGTNSSQSLVVGNGSSLAAAGTGTITATSAAEATHATNADNATHATSADSATNATHATNADSATNATNAAFATTAGSAATAGHAGTADSATNADNAGNLGGQPAASYARLDLANLFGAGKKQTFQADSTLAGLNIAGVTADPGTVASGDLWFNLTDHHLHFRDDQNHTKSLAFLGDTINGTFTGDGSGLTNLNADQLSSGTVPAGRLTGTYNISITGNAATADNASHATTADNATHATSADSATHATSADTATSAGHATTADSATNAAHAALADLATLATNAGHATTADSATSADHATTADSATDSSKLGGVDAANYARRDTENTFAAGKKQTVQSNADFAGLNIAGFTGDPINNPLLAGDLWFNLTEDHLKFQDHAGNTRTLAFTNDTLSGDGSGLTNLNASNLSSGTVPTGRLTGTYGIDISGNAATATHATSADNATHADSADNATHANSADNATHATNADHATSADSATNAAHAVLADLATLATNAGHATTADSATNADHASAADDSSKLGGVDAANYARRDAANTFSATQALAPAGATSQPSNTLQFNSTDGSSVSQTAQLLARNDGALSFQFGPTSGPILEKASVDKNGVFTGDGSGLTNLNSASLGTVGIGNGGTGATTAAGARTNLGAAASGANADITSLSGLTNVSSTVSFTNAGSTFAGTAASATSALTAATAGAVPWAGVSAGANTQALTVDSGGSLSPTGTGAITANFVPVAPGAAPSANGAIAYDSTANRFKVGVNGASNTLALLGGGNIFLSGKQTLAAAAAAFASLNFPNTGTAPTTPVLGDLWLTTGDNHLQFQSAAGLKSLAFTSDLSAGTVTSITAGTGLSGGTITTSGTINLVAATAATLGGVKAPTCAAGSHFGGIAVDGTLNCTADTTTTSLSFSAITGGTNSGQSLVVGNGSTLAPGGTGTITATSAATATLAGNVTGVVAIANGGTGISTSPSAAGQYLRSSAANTWAVNTGVQTSDLSGATVRVSASTTSANNPSAGTIITATASCAAGRVLLGGGAQVTSTAQRERTTLLESYPSSATQWTAVGTPSSNVTGGNTMTVTAYALCSGS